MNKTNTCDRIWSLVDIGGEWKGAILFDPARKVFLPETFNTPKCLAQGQLDNENRK